jgi:malonate-semialdehyde dehydrogenase (acetylating)/methylmalonate-semialdehyde dehydrogenase
MKKILISRKLLKSSEEYASKIFNVQLNKDDKLLTKDELISNSSECDGILSSLTEKFDADIISKLSKKVELLKVGPGLDKSSEMGPLVTKEHLERVKGYVDLGVKEGAKLVVDGRNIKLQGFEKGFYIGGCLFDNVNKKMRIYKEEIFGPVLSVVRVKDFISAVNLVNDHELGNGTSIYTRDGDVGRTFASKIKIGMVGINIPIPVPVAYHSFGGWKKSLFGDQHMHGPEGVRFYTKLKTITSKWPTGLTLNADFKMPTLN